MREVGDEIKMKDEQLETLDYQIEDIASGLPNLPHESVPVGDDEADNLEVRKWGTPKTFDYEAKSHWEIAELLDIVDFERGSKGAKVDVIVANEIEKANIFVLAGRWIKVFVSDLF